MTIGDGIINYIGLLMNWNSFWRLGLMIIELIKILMVGGDGLIVNNRIFF